MLPKQRRIHTLVDIGTKFEAATTSRIACTQPTGGYLWAKRPTGRHLIGARLLCLGLTHADASQIQPPPAGQLAMISCSMLITGHIHAIPLSDLHSTDSTPCREQLGLEPDTIDSEQWPNREHYGMAVFQHFDTSVCTLTCAITLRAGS